jgi:hypothetical protein
MAPLAAFRVRFENRRMMTDARGADDDGQNRVLEGHGDDAENHRQALLSVVDDPCGGRFADQGGVVEDRGEVGAGMGAPELRQISPEQGPEQPDLNVADHAVAHAIGDQGLDHLGDAANNPAKNH